MTVWQFKLDPVKGGRAIHTGSSVITITIGDIFTDRLQMGHCAFRTQSLSCEFSFETTAGNTRKPQDALKAARKKNNRYLGF